MLRKILIEIEDLLGKLPRLVLLAGTVFLLRNPLVGGVFEGWAWWVKLPCEFALVLFLALALCAGIRLATGHQDDGD